MSWIENNENKKILVFQNSASFLMINKDRALTKIADVIRQVRKAGSDLICVFSPHESLPQVSDLDPGLWEKYTGLLDELKAGGDIVFDEEGLAMEHVDECNAYYGSPTHLAHVFQISKKPVMIMDADILGADT